MTTAFLGNTVLDSGLAALANCTHVYLCSALPTTYTQATDTYALGAKAGPTVGAPAARTGGGRQVTISAFTEGTATATGTATHWAAVDANNTELLAAGPLSSSLAIGTGYAFSLSALVIGMPGAA